MVRRVEFHIIITNLRTLTYARMVIHRKWAQMNFSLLLVPSLMFLPLMCSHINQKTQFENPVMEAKRKLSAETPTGAPGPAAPPAGNCIRSCDLWSKNDRYVVTYKVIWNRPMTWVCQRTFSHLPQFLQVGGRKRCSCEWSDLFYLAVCLSFTTDGPCRLVTEHAWPATVTHLCR